MKRSIRMSDRLSVCDQSHAQRIAEDYLLGTAVELRNCVTTRPPSFVQEHMGWHVSMFNNAGELIGSIVVDARSGIIREELSTDISDLLAEGEYGYSNGEWEKDRWNGHRSPIVNSTILEGDSEETLKLLPDESVDLVFTSPPYFNAKPEYAEYDDYNSYLEKMGAVFKQCHRVISEGRFLVVNLSPVIVPRPKRSMSSTRLAVPFDMHSVIMRYGFDFVDDIVWVKPEGASGHRGRRFSKDRQPLQYKTVPVTEYVLVYRKQTDKLIDWNIRNHPNQNAVEDSKVSGPYQRTNVWHFNPDRVSWHPAPFPLALAERIVQYYSFKGDVVLDPFAGSGTVAEACYKLGRKFIMSEYTPEYVDHMRVNMSKYMELDAGLVHYVDTAPVLSVEYYE